VLEAGEEMKKVLVGALAALALAGCGGSGASPPAQQSGGQQTAGTSDRHVPLTLTIGAIGVSAHVEQVGVDKNGNMAIPADPHNAGWYGPGVAPGEHGNAVIDGHLDWYGMPEGPFHHLDALKAGDQVGVKALDGTTFVFQVAGPATAVSADARPSGLFRKSGSPTLTLITCGGQWDASKRSYSERELVNATLVSGRAPGP
jgi:LPXTG-site transpeptidase (sortase) family protein